MDFGSIIRDDDQLKSIVRIKWHPFRVDLDYIEALPPQVQDRLYTALFGREFPTTIPPEFLPREINARAQSTVSETKYYAELYRLLHEYEFQQSFRKADGS